MPALQPVLGVARVSVQGTANGRQIVNVFHVRKGLGTAAWGQTELDALAGVMNTQFATAFASSISNSYSGDSVECQDLSSLTGFFSQVASTTTGGAGSTIAPASAASCVTWKIARHYRGGHPRTYIGPLAGGALETATSLTSAFVTALKTKATTFLTNINLSSPGGATVSLVTVHRTRDGDTLTPPEVSLIQGVEVDARIDSQRRRLGPDR